MHTAPLIYNQPENLIKIPSKKSRLDILELSQNDSAYDEQNKNQKVEEEFDPDFMCRIFYSEDEIV